MSSNFCKILNKVRLVPKSFDKFLSDSDILFRAHGLFVLIDNENNLTQPYEIISEIGSIRLDKRVLANLDDKELSVILYQAKIEIELQKVISERDVLLDMLDDIILNRYPELLINNINEKLQKFYN